MNSIDFDPIRPYQDHEVANVLKELCEEPDFISALAFIFPEAEPQILIEKLKKINSVFQFQSEIIAGSIKKIISRSITEIETKGIEVLNEKKPVLLISNHRDIVLDSALLNYELFRHGLPTTRIAIGNNLLQKSWIEKLVRLNKNFIVHRNIQARQAYEFSLRISAFIRKSITNDNESVWIAQREGRTKDGNDLTQVSLLKMLGLSATSDEANVYAELNILPLSLAYQWEPCAGMKAREMYIRQKTGGYQKAPGEDLTGMQQGITQQKGKVSIHFGKLLTPYEIRNCFEGKNRNEGLKNLAELIDKQIQLNYQLSPFNYYAADQFHHNNRYAQYYNQAVVEQFEAYMDEELKQFEERDAIKPFLLQIYANPVKD